MLDSGVERLPELIGEFAEPLPEIDEPKFGAMFNRFANARAVLLGEASQRPGEEETYPFGL